MAINEKPDNSTDNGERQPMQHLKGKLRRLNPGLTDKQLEEMVARLCERYGLV